MLYWNQQPAEAEQLLPSFQQTSLQLHSHWWEVFRHAKAQLLLNLQHLHASTGVKVGAVGDLRVHARERACMRNIS
jgi:hypothetical protein